MHSGLNDHATEGTFRWTDCTTVSLLVDPWQARNWAAGEPSGPLSLTEQDCGTFTAEGQWADEVCNLRKKYICEIVPKGKSQFFVAFFFNLVLSSRFMS